MENAPNASRPAPTPADLAALLALCQKVTPDHVGGGKFEEAIGRSLSVTAVWKIRMEQVTGKAKLEKPRG